MNGHLIVRRRPLAAAAVCSAGLFATGALADVFHVDAQDGNDIVNSGLTWDDPLATVQRAIEKAADTEVADLIKVAQGLYKPTVPANSRTATFLLNASLLDTTIEGGYAGLNSGVDPDTRDLKLYETILSGDLPAGGAAGPPSCDNPPPGAGNCLTATPGIPFCTNPECCAAVCDQFPVCCAAAWDQTCAGTYAPLFPECTVPPPSDDAYHVVTFVGVDVSVRLDGVTIIGGVANGTGTDQNRGGGILIRDAGPLVVQCTFHANSAIDGGAVAIVSTTSSPAPPPAMPLLFNCSFFGNTADANGGAVLNYASVPQFTNCVFNGNTATSGNGGALFNDGVGLQGHSGDSILLNCTLTANTAANGGGIYSAGPANGDGSATVGNSIVWANSGSGEQIANLATVTFSCVQRLPPGSPPFPGAGNINSDPRFVNAAGSNGTPGDDDDDLRLHIELSQLSPCIDAGDNTVVPPDAADLDADGNPDERTPLDHVRLPRFTENANASSPCDPVAVDMGAFENADCNMNEVRDETELEGNDVNGDGILDGCQDCNANNILDNEEVAGCDLCTPTCHDCNKNGRPDECDLLNSCDTDTNQNGVPDACDLPVGYRLRQFFAPMPGIGRGMAFDGVHLYYTRVFTSADDPNIYQATPTGEGVPAGAIVPMCPGNPPVPVGRQLGALAFDGTGPTPTLWAATYDYDPPVLYQIEITSGHVLRAIHTLPANPGDPYPTLIDGLAFDPHDGSLFYSTDLGLQVFNVTAAHVPDCTGAPANQITTRGFYFAEGDMSGHAYDGAYLYTCQPDDGHSGTVNSNPPPQILRTLPDSPTINLNFQTIGLGDVPFHGEGLALDDVTFFPDCAIWVNGADETHYIAAFRVPCPCSAACPADFDGNCVVDTVDFLALLQHWGPCPAPCPWDTDGNGVVDTVDFLFLLQHWGPCPVPCYPG